MPGVSAAASVRQAMRLLPCVKQPPSAGVARPGTHPVTAEPAALHEPPAAGPERRQAAGRRAQHGQQMNVRIRACQSRCRATATAGSGRKDNTGRGRLTSRSCTLARTSGWRRSTTLASGRAGQHSAHLGSLAPALAQTKGPLAVLRLAALPRERRAPASCVQAAMWLPSLHLCTRGRRRPGALAACPCSRHGLPNRA